MSLELEDVVNTTNQVKAKVVDEVWLENLNKTAYTIIMPIICAFGILGNCLNLIVLTRKNLKAATYIYLRAMAVSDLMSLVFTIPMIIRYAQCQLTTFAAAWYHAHLELPLANAFIGSSVLVTVAITVERFIAVCIPMQAKKYQTPIVAKYVIITGFVVSFALYSPMCLYKYVTLLSENSTDYTYTVDKALVLSLWFLGYEWCREVILRLGPTIVLALMNIKIVVVFYKKVKRRRSQMQTNRRDQRKFREDQRLIILLISIVILFLVCTLPASILILFYNTIDHDTYEFHVFRAAANLAEITNYALNFYIYCLCSPEFRNTFLNTFCVCSKKVRTSHSVKRESSYVETRVGRPDGESLERLTSSTQTSNVRSSTNSEMNSTTNPSSPQNPNSALENHLATNLVKDKTSKSDETCNSSEKQLFTDKQYESISQSEKKSNMKRHKNFSRDIPITSIQTSSEEKLNPENSLIFPAKEILVDRPNPFNENILRRSNSEKFENSRKLMKSGSLKRSPDSLRHEKGIFMNGIPKVRSKPEKLSNFTIDSKRLHSKSSSSASSGSGSIGSKRKLRIDGISTSV